MGILLLSFVIFEKNNAMIRLKDLVAVFEQLAPFSLQESYDNSGIQIGHPDKIITRGLVCLDVSPEVLDEAIEQKCDVIISHHPLLFKGLKQINGLTAVDQVVMKAIREDVAIVSVHTNLDHVIEGVNGMLAEKIGLSKLSPLSPATGLLKKLVTFCPPAQAEVVREALFSAGAGQIGDYDCCSYNLDGYGTFRAGAGTNPFVGKKNELHEEAELRIETIFPVYLQQQVMAALINAHPYEEVAYDIYPLDNKFGKAGNGLCGWLKEPLKEEAFLLQLKEILGLPCLRHSERTGKVLHKIAICGGSGGFLLPQVMAAGADAFISAELKHNQFLECKGRLLLIDAGHYETEQFTKELMVDIVNKKMLNFALLISREEKNPVYYL
jgi:dinuclear metal center YbgI/SA1388 family protein